MIILVTASCVPGLISLKKQPYVPIDLNDCFVQLDSILSPAELDTLRNWTEEDMNMAHMSLGLWIRNNWGLWRGSRLSKWFNAQSIWHPDDMSGIILTSYWRYLNNRPMELDAQIKYYVDYWIDHSYPDTLKCSICGKKLKNFYMEGVGVDANYPYVVTSVLFCSKKHPWFYSRSHGLYGIDEDKYRGLLDTFKLRSKGF
jgi:hypothetical protein